jgi:hypothetical protein
VATSAVSTFELNRDAIVRRALQLAGLLEASAQPEAADVSMGSDLLNMVLLDLQSDGTLPTHVTRSTLDLVASTASYTLPTDTLDVAIDANNFVGTIYNPTSGTETPVHAMTRSEYVGIPDKTTEATPTRVYVERLSTVSALFWPVPSDSTLDFRYQQIRIGRDTSPGSVTLDLSRRWQLAITYDLAAHLGFAKSIPLDRRSALRKEAEMYKARARNSDVEKVHMQMAVWRDY